MPNLTTPFLNLGGTDIDKDMDEVQNWSIALIDELKYILCNLDAGNCMEAAKVKAQNIDCSQAMISSAQIYSLKAGKIRTGTLNVSDAVTIQGESDDARMVMNAQTLIFYEKDERGKEIPRIYMGYDKDSGKYVFEVYNKEGQKEIYMNDDGNVVFSGTITGGKIEADTDISVNKNAYVGQYLNVGYISSFVDDDGKTNYKWYDTSGIHLGPGVFIKAENNGENLVFQTVGRITFGSSSVKKGQFEIATERDIAALEDKINNLEAKIETLEQIVAGLV